ncbi:MAG: GFA family protein [Pseudomonadales bacterium]
MRRTYAGSCHCGRFRFEVDADIDHVRVCDCSICHQRGALIHRVPKEDVRLLTPLSELTLYQWGTMTAEDYFCPVCGILPLRRPRTRHASEAQRQPGVAPFDGWAVNTRCLQGFDPSTVRTEAVHGSRLPLP